MLFCQLGRADSLREICNGLGCCLGRLVHVGITHAPRRSTLSYANEHRPAARFEDLFWAASARFREQQALGGKKHKFRFKNKLLSLDSTTISLCLTMFPWANFRRAKGGVKAHVLLDCNPSGSSPPRRAVFLKLSLRWSEAIVQYADDESELQIAWAFVSSPRRPAAALAQLPHF